MLGLLSIFFSALSLGVVPSEPVQPPREVSPVVEIQPATVKAAEQYFSPVNLKISSINLNVPVLSVGADVDGTQLVPDDNGTVSWWKYGAKPGEVGSAVLAGHYKIDDGSPGVFYRLNEVKIGEMVSVTDEHGVEQQFRVVDRKIFPVPEFPTIDIYENSDSESLNLVTCTGEYISETNNYTHRLVIYTEKVE